MPVICLGPVCVPLHLLLPFLIGLAHQYGYLKWFKREWVTLRFWTNKFRGKKPAGGATAGGTGTSDNAQASADANGSTVTATGPTSEPDLQRGPKGASQANGEGRPNTSGPPAAQTQQQAQGQVNKKDD